MARDKESRLRILVVASALFARNGYNGTSIRKIGKICGLQQPSIYHHFSDKKNLYALCIRATRQLMIRVFRQCLLKTEDISAELYSYFLVFREWREVFEGTLFPGEISVMTHFLTSAPEDLRKETGHYIDRGLRRMISNTFKRHSKLQEKEIREKLFLAILYGFIFQYSNLTIGKFNDVEIVNHIKQVTGREVVSEHKSKARARVRRRLEKLRGLLLDRLDLA